MKEELKEEPTEEPTENKPEEPSEAPSEPENLAEMLEKAKNWDAVQSQLRDPVAGRVLLRETARSLGYDDLLGGVQQQQTPEPTPQEFPDVDNWDFLDPAKRREELSRMVNEGVTQAVRQLRDQEIAVKRDFSSKYNAMKPILRGDDPLYWSSYESVLDGIVANLTPDQMVQAGSDVNYMRMLQNLARGQALKQGLVQVAKKAENPVPEHPAPGPTVVESGSDMDYGLSPLEKQVAMDAGISFERYAAQKKRLNQ